MNAVLQREIHVSVPGLYVALHHLSRVLRTEVSKRTTLQIDPLFNQQLLFLKEYQVTDKVLYKRAYRITYNKFSK